MRNKRLFSLVAVLALCAGLTGCSGNDTQNAADNVSAADASPGDTLPQENAADGGGSADDAGNGLSLTEPAFSKDPGTVAYFFGAFGDPEADASLYADLPQAQRDMLESAAYSFRLENAQCTVTAKPYTFPEDAEAYHVTVSVTADDAAALSRVIGQTRMLETLCNYDDEADANREYAYSRLEMQFENGEAWHRSNSECLLSPGQRGALVAFFYELLDRSGASFYFHPVAYADEEVFIESFLGTAPWDALSVTLNDGTDATLVLSSDVTGRVFRLDAGDNSYAGNYRLRKREDDGRWRVDLTLTNWPADYTPMTKGGTVLIDTAVGAGVPDGSGTETLVITKYPNMTSIFDPYYGEDGALSFTRPRTEFFSEKPFATQAEEDGADGT